MNTFLILVLEKRKFVPSILKVVTPRKTQRQLETQFVSFPICYTCLPTSVICTKFLHVLQEKKNWFYILGPLFLPRNRKYKVSFVIEIMWGPFFYWSSLQDTKIVISDMLSIRRHCPLSIITIPVVQIKIETWNFQ